MDPPLIFSFNFPSVFDWCSLQVCMNYLLVRKQKIYLQKNRVNKHEQIQPIRCPFLGWKMHAFLWNVLMDKKSWESKNVKARSHLASKSTFTSAFASNINIMSNMDAYARDGYRSHSFRLRFVTIASIIFEKANAEVNGKCEWALPPKFFELSTIPSWLRVTITTALLRFCCCYVDTLVAGQSTEAPTPTPSTAPEDTTPHSTSGDVTTASPSNPPTSSNSSQGKMVFFLMVNESKWRNLISTATFAHNQSKCLGKNVYIFDFHMRPLEINAQNSPW